mgnify:CR=1 FL=1
MGELANAYKYLRISTHAPAGGATWPEWLSQIRPGNFYSRPCGRGDDLGTWTQQADMPFLLTPLREGRRQL